MRSRSNAAVSATAPASIEPLRLPPVPAPNGVTAGSPRLVAPWLLDRVDGHAPGGDVEQHLASEGLELPRAAIRTPPGRAREHRGREEAGLGNAVRTGEQHSDGDGSPDGPRRGIGADVL